MSRFRRFVSGFLLILVPVVTGAAEIRGRVELTTGSRGRRSADLADTVIYFTPEAGAVVKVVKEPPRAFDIVTHKKEFKPRVLVVPVGSTVRFPIDDMILHNVFSVSGENRFDLGLYRRGEAREVAFGDPGVVRVYCNVHHGMVAYVMVLETGFHTAPDKSGAFLLPDLPAAGGTLTVWHERARLWSQEVRLPLDQPVKVSLEVNKSRLPRHLNKFGKPYSRDGRRYR